MNTRPTTKRAGGWSVWELLLVLVVVIIAAERVLHSMNHCGARATTVNCVSNLKQIGTAYRMFANDHNGLFPSEVSTNESGAKEFVRAGEAFRHFRALANLSSPKIVVCPADVRLPASRPNFTIMNNSNVSYFASLNATTNEVSMFLAGDRNLIRNGLPTGNCLVTVRTNDVLEWTQEIHKGVGNIGLADGSVQQLTINKLKELVKVSENTQRLSIP